VGYLWALQDLEVRGNALGLSRWDVPEEFWMLWWRSREHRQFVIDVTVEPAGKGRRGRRLAPEFQRQVMDQMERYGRYPMRGPVALDLSFRAARRNPPGIHRAVKHTLDLLGPALPGTERARRRSVLYRDDRQVKFLYADMDQEWWRQGGDDTAASGLFMVARRASDVAADLGMAVRLHRNGWDEGDEDSLFWVPGLPDEPEPGWPLDPGSSLSPVEQYLADSFRFHHVTDMQEAILARTDASLNWALATYLGDLDAGSRHTDLASILKESRAATRGLLLSDMLTIPLPGLPRATGQSADFVQMTRASLEQFRVQWPLFRSLLVPVTLTFLVIPPVQGKDLDNIALTVLPVAHEILRPHIAPHLLSPTYGDEKQTPWLNDALDRLKSVNARSVRSYQVIELPRSPQDPPEGTLHLALGLHTHHSWWHRATDYLCAAIDHADQRGRLDDSTWRSIFG
jgi:hypothetical protein